MVENPFNKEAPESKKRDYSAEIVDLAREIEVELPQRAVDLAAELLERMYQSHGNPDSETYKHYHNDQHALNVIRRSFRLWQLLRGELPEKIDQEGYELLLIAGAGHDLVVHSGREHGYDEKESARMTAECMRAVGYSDEQIFRVEGAIKATTVVRDEEGNIIQDSIRSGTKDPLRLVLATADINGTTMEGIPTLVEDAINLHAEIVGALPEDVTEANTGIAHFLFSQAQFVDGRLRAIQGDLEFYFSPAEVAQIKKAYEREFTGATRDVISLSKTLISFPEMATSTVEKVTSSLGSTALSPLKKALKTAFARKKK